MLTACRTGLLGLIVFRLSGSRLSASLPGLSRPPSHERVSNCQEHELHGSGQSGELCADEFQQFVYISCSSSETLTCPNIDVNASTNLVLLETPGYYRMVDGGVMLRDL